MNIVFKKWGVGQDEEDLGEVESPLVPRIDETVSLKRGPGSEPDTYEVHSSDWMFDLETGVAGDVIVWLR